MSALADHLWQSLQVSGCVAVLAWLTRHNSARFRVWLWRVAALKFLLPFHLLQLMGEWLGFPLPHASNAPPHWLVGFIHDWGPWFAPARQLEGSTWQVFCAALALGSAGGVYGTTRQWANEAELAAAELARLERDPDDQARSLGFIKAALITAGSVIALAAPLLAGAVDDRLKRLRMLHANERSLHAATVIVRPAAPGMGTRFRLSADENGVNIRNASLRDLAGLAYGVHPSMVRGRHFVKEGQQDWLTGARYDVRIAGRVIEPAEFDAYALRDPVTRHLATEFGIEIYRNSECQPPCGRWGSFVLPESARAAAPPPEH